MVRASSIWPDQTLLTLANRANIPLCLGLVNKKCISSGSSSHEWLWSVLNPTRHFALSNRARFLWEEQAWPNAEHSSHRCWNSTAHISVVNPTHLVCMYLTKFVELATTMPREVHLNKSRQDRKYDGHTFGIVVSSHRLGMPLLLHLRSHMPSPV